MNADALREQCQSSSENIYEYSSHRRLNVTRKALFNVTNIATIGFTCMFYSVFFNRAAHSNTYCVLNLTYDNNCMCEWKKIITEMTKELFSKCEINKTLNKLRIKHKWRYKHMGYDFNIYTMSYKNNLSYWLNQTQTFIKLKQAIKYNSFRDVKLKRNICSK